ncbi:MAG TPA: hypothetical protein VEH06_12550 [Candidatus Bathyarchaeia archaeon]|nr:hypothetical protein [Candidatus Bathyarchaeia archaeon]
MALVILAAVLLSTLVIGSTSASSKVFSNSGNSIITNQNCTAGNSCDLSSSNVINREPTSTMSSPPTLGASPVCGQCLNGPCPLLFSFAVADLAEYGHPDQMEVTGGKMNCGTGTVFLTNLNGEQIQLRASGPAPIRLSQATATTDQYGDWPFPFAITFPTPTTPGNYRIDAMFNGDPNLGLPSEFWSVSFSVPVPCPPTCIFTH